MSETQELILEKLGILCRLFPQQRFGQIFYNYVLRYCPGGDPFYIEDNKMLELLEKIIENVEKSIDNN